KFLSFHALMIVFSTFIVHKLDLASGLTLRHLPLIEMFLKFYKQSANIGYLSQPGFGVFQYNYQLVMDGQNLRTSKLTTYNRTNKFPLLLFCFFWFIRRIKAV